MKWIVIWGLFASAVLTACDKPATPAAAPAESTAEAQPALPTEAQGTLPAIRLWLGPAEVNAEMALTQRQEETGLMFRTNLPEDHGMIFVFPKPVQASFWMKNCTVPLSCAYIAPDGQILEIHNLEPQNTTPVVADSPNIQYVLEVNQGWFKRHDVSTGTYVRTERGTLRETFFTRAAR